MIQVGNALYGTATRGGGFGNGTILELHMQGLVLSLSIISMEATMGRGQNKEISEADPAINALREFVKARNVIVHHKRKEMSFDLNRASKQASVESARFWLV